MAFKEIKAVIFDIGRVIVNLHPERGIFKYFLEPGRELDEGNMMNFVRDESANCFMRGLMTPEEFHSEICGRFKLNLEFNEFCELWCNIFSLNQETAKLIEELSGITTVGLLSDADELHWGFLKGKYSVFGLIDRPTISYMVGYTKPAKQIYLAAAENAETAMENCLFIDDLAINVEGAKKAGMQSIQFESAKQVRSYLSDCKVLI